MYVVAPNLTTDYSAGLIWYPANNIIWLSKCHKL